MEPSSDSEVVNDAPWTAEEDRALKSYFDAGRSLMSWSEISNAAFQGRRSRQACCDRWKQISKPKSSKGPWTKQEDDALTSLVDVHGPEKWTIIATALGTRSGKQCRERWYNHVNPTINKSPWTSEETAKIHQMYNEMGPKWAEMAKNLPGRPDNAIKNYFNAQLARRMKKERSDSVSTTSTFDNNVTSTPSSSSMSRGDSLISSPRYSPYVRSANMGRSRSEQSPGMFTPAFTPMHRPNSGDFSPAESQSATPFPSVLVQPSKKDTGASSTPAYSPPTPMSASHMSRSLASAATPAPESPFQIMPRDLSKDVFDRVPTTGQQGYDRFTPPATPNRADNQRPTTRLSASLSSPMKGAVLAAPAPRALSKSVSPNLSSGQASPEVAKGLGFGFDPTYSMHPSVSMPYRDSDSSSFGDSESFRGSMLEVDASYDPTDLYSSTSSSSSISRNSSGFFGSDGFDIETSGDLMGDDTIIADVHSLALESPAYLPNRINPFDEILLPEQQLASSYPAVYSGAPQGWVSPPICYPYSVSMEDESLPEGYLRAEHFPDGSLHFVPSPTAPPHHLEHHPLHDPHTIYEGQHRIPKSYASSDYDGSMHNFSGIDTPQFSSSASSTYSPYASVDTTPDVSPSTPQHGLPKHIAAAHQPPPLQRSWSHTQLTPLARAAAAAVRPRASTLSSVNPSGLRAQSGHSTPQAVDLSYATPLRARGLGASVSLPPSRAGSFSYAPPEYSSAEEALRRSEFVPHMAAGEPLGSPYSRPSSREAPLPSKRLSASSASPGLVSQGRFSRPGSVDLGSPNGRPLSAGHSDGLMGSIIARSTAKTASPMGRKGPKTHHPTTHLMEVDAMGRARGPAF